MQLHCTVAVNKRTVLAIVPPHCPQGCFLMSKEIYNRSKYTIGILTLILLGRASFMWNNAVLHILSSVFLTAVNKREGVFTNKQYRLGCSILIKMASQPCGGTIHNKPKQCMSSQLTARQLSSHCSPFVSTQSQPAKPHNW